MGVYARACVYVRVCIYACVGVGVGVGVGAERSNRIFPSLATVARSAPTTLSLVVETIIFGFAAPNTV